MSTPISPVLLPVRLAPFTSRPSPSRLLQHARALHKRASRCQHSAAVSQARPIKTVTVAGITGALGLPVIHAVADAGFRVQALTRHPSSAAALSIPPTATLLETDYHHPPSLRASLRGQDAVISCLGDTPSAVAAQRALIDASVEAGVGRFIPSEFGSDPLHPFVRSLPFFKDKIEHQAVLREAASSVEGFSWTVLVTGPFLDWGLSVVPFILDIGSRSAEIIDGGDVPFSTTRTPAVARALGAILSRSEETRNRALYIHEAVVTQNQLLAQAVRHLNRRDGVHSGSSHFLPSFENTLALCRSLDLAHRKKTDFSDSRYHSDPRDYSDHDDHGDHNTTSDHSTTSHRSDPREFRDPRDHSNNGKPTDPDPNGLFSVTRSSSPALLQALHSAHATTGANPLAWILPSVNLSFCAEGAPCLFPPGKTDNDLLGVREMSRSVDVTALIDGEVGRAGDVFLRNRGESGTGKIRDVERERGREAMVKGRRKLVGCE